MTDDLTRQRRLKTAILDRVEDLAGEEERLAVALIETGFDLLVASHRAQKLSSADRAAIRDNYTAAAPDLIEARSLDEAGLREAVGTAETFARIYIDYSPLSHWKADRRNDARVADGMADEATGLVRGMHEKWEGAGVSRFGVCCVLILTTAREALTNGLAWPKVVRICLDAIQLSYRGIGGSKPVMTEREVAQILVDRMGTSKAVARRYVAAAKAMKP